MSTLVEWFYGSGGNKKLRQAKLVPLFSRIFCVSSFLLSKKTYLRGSLIVTHAGSGRNVALICIQCRAEAGYHATSKSGSANAYKVTWIWGLITHYGPLVINLLTVGNPAETQRCIWHKHLNVDAVDLLPCFWEVAHLNVCTRIIFKFQITIQRGLNPATTLPHD